jgi:hypothetical protein
MGCFRLGVVAFLALASAACGGGGSAGGGGGAGTLFQLPAAFALGVERDPAGVVVADFNRDGTDDIAVTNSQAGTVAVALGSGNGLISERREFGLDALSAPTALVSGDFDRDGRPDLAILARESVDTGEGPELFERVVILEGHRTAGYDALGPAAEDFTLGAIVTIGSGYFPTDIVTADLDNDGDLDLAVSTQGGDDVQVIFGNGDGTFDAPVQRTIAAGFDSSALVAAHLDRDAYLDLAVTSGSDGRVAILLGHAENITSFEAPSFVTVAAGASLSCIAAARIDRQEVVDLVVGDRTGSRVVVLRGQGSGSGTPGYDVWNEQSLPTPPNAITAADIDRDGLPDVLVATNGVGEGDPGVLQVCLGQANATIGAPMPFSTGGIAPVALALADLDRNGSLDVVLAHAAENSFGTLLGTSRVRPGTTSYYTPGSANLQAYPARNTLVITDITRDGRPDVVVAERFGSAIEVLLGGDGKEFSPSRRFATQQFGGEALSLVAGDFNGDANTDVIVGFSFGSTFGVFAGTDTDPVLAPVTGIPTNTTFGTPNVVPRDMAVGDVDRDGKLDLVLVNPNLNALYVTRGNGDLTFAPATSLPTALTRLEVVALGDLDNDGDLDIVAMKEGGEIRAWRGDGHGTFAASQVSTTPDWQGLPHELELADVDGDGRLDAIAATVQGARVGKGFGDGTFGPLATPSPYFNTGAAVDIAAMDLNRDGKVDLVPHTSGPSYPLLGNGTGAFSQSWSLYVYLQYGFGRAGFAAGDLDADGRIDFVDVHEDRAFIYVHQPYEY